MKVLNLYAGLGGNRQKWTGCQVTAIEHDPKIAAVYNQLYPDDEIVIGDAHEYLLQNYDKFDFIWSSPPCQSHTGMMKATRHDVRKYPDMSIYQQILWLQHFCKGKFVIENVKPYYKPLIHPTNVLGRHYFWANFHIPPFEVPAATGFVRKGGQKQVDYFKKWLGINYKGNLYYEGHHDPCQVLRNCVHPDLGKHIFDRLLRVLNKHPNQNEQPPIQLRMFTPK